MEREEEKGWLCDRCCMDVGEADETKESTAEVSAKHARSFARTKVCSRTSGKHCVRALSHNHESGIRGMDTLSCKTSAHTEVGLGTCFERSVMRSRG